MEYKIIRSERRTLAVQINKDGTVTVRAPKSVSQKRIEQFVEKNSAWIKKHLLKIQTENSLPAYTNGELNAFKDKTKQILIERLPYFAKIIGVTYGKVSVKGQKTLWGSCSARGNLSFNRLLSALPQEIFDYVIIHELCHRIYMNHSAKFWHAVEKFCSDYKLKRKWLKVHGGEFLIRVK